jgi:hypothetical protein
MKNSYPRIQTMAKRFNMTQRDHRSDKLLGLNSLLQSPQCRPMKTQFHHGHLIGDVTKQKQASIDFGHGDNHTCFSTGGCSDQPQHDHRQQE